MSLSAFLSTPRAASMMVFAAFGAVVGTFSGSIPVILQQTGMSGESFGLALTAMSIASVAAMVAGGRAARLASNRAILMATMPLVGIGLVLIMTAHSSPLLFGSLIFYGAVIGLTDCVMNAEASAIEHDLQKPVFTAFHGILSVMIAAAAILSSMLTDRYGTLASCALPMAAIIAALWSAYRRMPVRPLPATALKGSARVASLPLILIGLAIGFSNSAEMSAVFWSAQLLHELAPRLAAIAGLGVAFFSLFAAAVRFAGDALRAHFGDVRLMQICLTAAIFGFIGLWISPGFAFSIFAFALVGLGISVAIPCLLNLAAGQASQNRAGGIGFASMVAGGPRILAPYFFGWLSGAFSIKAAFGACAVITLAALAIVMILSRQPNLTGQIRAAQESG